MTTDSLNPPGSTIRLTRERLEHLRDQLRARGQRPSVATSGKTTLDVVEAMEIVEEYGPICEAMYLMMSADHRVVNAEREVLKGALDVLSGGRVRTMHIEAMLDSAAKKCTKEGRDARLKKVIEQLKDDAGRAEVACVLAAAVAAADARIVPEESAILDAMFKGLGIDAKRANELLHEVDGKVST